MSLDNIKNAIKEFLSNDTPEVLCLRGKWGVGKTYLWKHCYNQLKEDSNSIKLGKYSYVSLFGIGSVQDLKLEILSQNSELTKSFDKMLSLVASANVRGVNFSNFANVINKVRFDKIKDYIICIDDIERKSSSLHIRDILGLICYLRDEKRCKVVMLQNSDALEKNDEEYLNKYAEKIIDYDITLEPTAEDTINIVFGNGNKEEGELLRENIKKLQINNIRIIKKIQNHANQILKYLPQGKFQTETVKSALSTLCLYCDIYYAPNPDKPTLEFVMMGELWERKDESESDKKWRKMLSSYGYTGTDNMDREIYYFIKNGYINVSAFERSALELDRQYQLGTVENKYKKAWYPYHNSLKINSNELLDAIYSSFKEAVHTISAMNLNSTYILFKDLGDNERAKEILEFYIAEHNPEFFESQELWMFDKPHPDVEEAFRRASQLHKKNNPISFNEVFERLAEGRNNYDDEEVLKSASVEEFYNFYSNLDGKNISLYVHGALNFETYSDDRRKIGGKAREALEKLASESLLRQKQLKKLGIIVNKN